MAKEMESRVSATQKLSNNHKLKLKSNSKEATKSIWGTRFDEDVLVILV